jgi:hypothetical protein
VHTYEQRKSLGRVLSAPALPRTDDLFITREDRRVGSQALNRCLPGYIVPNRPWESADVRFQHVDPNLIIALFSRHGNFAAIDFPPHSYLICSCTIIGSPVAYENPKGE